MKRKLQKIDLDQMEQQVFKWKCDKGIVFVNGVLVRENSRTIWEKRKNKRAIEIYEDSRCPVSYTHLDVYKRQVQPIA